MIKPIEFTAVFFNIEAMINDTPKQICQRVELGLFVTKNLQLQPDINPLYFYDKQAQLHRLGNLICFSLCVYLPHSIFKSFKVKHCIILKEYKNYQVGVSNVSCIAGLVACIAGLEGKRKTRICQRQPQRRKRPTLWRKLLRVWCPGSPSS